MSEVPIEAVVRITQMQARYGHLVDAREWAGFRDLFTEDAVFDLTEYGLGRLSGIEAIMDFFVAAPHPAAHHATNIEVWEDDGTVRARSKYVVANDDGTTAGGDYNDVLVELDRSWLFQARVVTRRWPGVAR